MTQQEVYTHAEASLPSLFTQPPSPVGEPGDVTLLRLINSVLRRRRLVAGCALAAAVLAVALALLANRTYSSTALFFPQSTQNIPVGVSGIAAQLGLSVPAGDMTQSPQFYADLLQSRPLLRSVADTRFEIATDTGSATRTLTDMLGGEQSTETLRREQAIDAIRSMVATEVSPRTGVIELKVTAGEPALARQMAERMLAYLNEFNLERRQSQAGAERKFAEKRLAEARDAQLAAEGKLLAFLQRNRDYANSPSLRFQQERLRQEVSDQQQLVAVLKQAYERARMDEVRDIPVLTVLESPETPARPNARHLVSRTILAFAAGALLGIMLAVAREWFSTNGAAASEDDVEFQRLRRETARDFLQPWRLLRNQARNVG